ncbi:MAG: ABC transporter substrate-binding protein [Spirochaetaceae bacterium]|jgi:peptide/nickel transport system substrate-binding protein|nr:ABC transporter substrate-binding protein [Spirochaetaceae bacterium]
MIYEKCRLRTLLILAFIAFLGGCSRNQTPPVDTAPVDAAAPSGTPLPGGELRFGITTEPATLDPLSPANTADGRSILFNVFEGLVKIAPEGTFYPAVAEHYEIRENGRVYTFRLRPGLTFHDGTLVSMEDVLFTLNTAMQAGFVGFDRIAGVQAASDTELSITLKAPDLEFLPYLTLGIVPKANEDREKNPIGTGPFSITSYRAQQSLVLEKNPRYWQEGLPHLDKVTYVFTADSDALLLALQGGNIDAANITSAVVQQLDGDRFDMLPSPSNSVQLLALNNAAPPLKDLRVRKAICYAVDVEEIIDAAFYGQGEPSGSPLIPGLSRYYDSSLKNPYPPDWPKARELLAEAGYGSGFSLKITVPANYTMHVDTAQVIVNQLAQVGITATISLVDWATWLDEVYRGRRYEATIISLDASQAAPRSFLERYRSDSGSNFVNFKSPAYDQVYDAILGEADEEQRIKLYHEAQRIISTEAASVYIQDIWNFRTFPKGRFAGVVHYPLYVFDLSPLYRLR